MNSELWVFGIWFLGIFISEVVMKAGLRKIIISKIGDEISYALSVNMVLFWPFTIVVSLIGILTCYLWDLFDYLTKIVAKFICTKILKKDFIDPQ